MSEVPAATLGSWIIKISATTLGETGGDAVTMALGLGYLIGTGIFAIVLVAALGAQLAVKRFHPFVYWTAIIVTTTNREVRGAGHIGEAGADAMTCHRTVAGASPAHAVLAISSSCTACGLLLPEPRCSSPAAIWARGAGSSNCPIPSTRPIASAIR